jgi:hypothetical protein
MTLEEESGGPTWVAAGAEGATAPETLRQMDLKARNLWKVDGGFSVVSPKGKAR